MRKDVFLSLGRTATAEQEEFVFAIERLLKQHNVRPRTVGRTDFVSGKPLKKILNVMKKCSGTIVIAFERFHFAHGVEFKGSGKEATLSEVSLPTVWNQVEAGMAYVLGHPLLAIAESHLKSEALLEEGYDWLINWVELTPASLHSPAFQATFLKWLKKVERYVPG
jgi:hypothetical protein